MAAEHLRWHADRDGLNDPIMVAGFVRKNGFGTTAVAALTHLVTAHGGQLVAEIEATLAPVKNRPFIVFHDAYQYFEHRFGLAVAGSVTVTPDSLPGAQRVRDLHAMVAAAGAVCVFAEPQFEPAVVNTIIEGTPAKAGTLDPEGAGLTEGPSLYIQLITGLADSLIDCLAQ